MQNDKKIGLWVYAFWPLVFIAICWMVWGCEIFIKPFPKLGVKPRTAEGLIGIFTHAFFHSTFTPDGQIDYSHILNNSVPLFLLGTGLFIHFKDLSYKVFFWLFLGTGFWLWSFGRPSNHIGASGIVYALFGFLVTSGFIRTNKNLLALSFLSIFLYGSMIWGIFPIDHKVSWEGHLSGLLMGIVLAIYFRKSGPKSTDLPISDDDRINEFKFGPDYWKTPEQKATDLHHDEEITEVTKPQNVFKINYIYTKKEDNDK